MTRITWIAFILMLNISLFAQHVEIDEAKTIAKNYISMQKGTASENALVISDQHVNYSKSGEVLSYIFNFEGGGFVIVSGDKRTTPVLAYSLSNTFLIDESKSHPAYLFVESYGNTVEQIKTAGIETEVSPKWNELATGKQHKAIIKTEGPFVTSKWNQDKYYNTLCPDEGDVKRNQNEDYDYHVPNGCVALAMAQIMYYHRYPRKGNGSSSYTSNYGELSANYGETVYDYEAMADVAEGYSDALARLIFHAGVSVSMGYGAAGSGAQSEHARTAFSQRFLYNLSSVIQGGDNPENNISWWKDTIRQSIDKKLPVYYAACRPGNVGETDPDGCHAFVCDGYQIDDTDPSADMFHFNFGWGGSSNDWYTLSTMERFTLSSRIIVNIEPRFDTNFFSGQKTLTATYGSFNDGSGRLDYRENTNCSWLISPQEGRNVTKIILKVASFSLADGDSVKIYAGNTESDPLIAVLTGDLAQNRSDTVNASHALVVFTSDGSLNGEGFTFNYSSTKTSSEYCSTSKIQTRIRDKAGSIDNGSGTANYDSGGKDNRGDDIMCYWAIAPEGMGNQVKFAFSHFDLAQGDVVEILAYPNTTTDIKENAWTTDSGTKPMRFSTDNRPILNTVVYTVSGPTALIRFRTDNNLTATGFRIYWEENMSIQENNFGLAQLSIYPNPANDIITVSLTTEKED
ncbi:MAG: C10 family peptidase, partial [Bacteroidales bacterium]|nr:C10 family peptidase [Bacteroidales bacterium]